MINCIFINNDKKITVKEVEEMAFDNDIYNNSGIVNELAGFIRYLIGEDHLHIVQIFVREDARRGGYGTLLVEKAIQVAKKHKKGKVIAFSHKLQGTQFGDFLIKKGFTEPDGGTRWEKQL